MQPRALGRRVSDEFAVPLCRTHHRALHRQGDEAAWWTSAGIDAVAIAQRLWQHTRLNGAPIQEHIDPLLGPPTVQAAKDGGPEPSAGPARPMTSWRQFQANRLNALKSTGPRTEEGKRISRRNALRHGLTAETVIDGLEDSEDYRGFEAAIIADYDAETAVERELVLRLASLLWRLRRIIAIETDLFQIQAEILRDRRNEVTTLHGELPDQAPEVLTLAEADRLSCNGPALSPRELTHCFLRLGNLDSGAFERLGRYNAALWKQTAQTLLLLGLRRRAKWRGAPPGFGSKIRGGPQKNCKGF